MFKVIKRSKMKKRIWIISGIILLGIIIFISYLKYDNDYSRESRIISWISKNKEIVNYYCKVNNIKPRVYISIVYGELHSNFNFFDNFDSLRAAYGFNASIGFGQMRISTVMWLEENYADGQIIKRSRNKNELTRKILNDKMNIAYTTFYVKLITDRLLSIDGKEPTIRQLGSFYSLGIDHGKRKINKDYTSNVGRVAEKFYYSNDLISIYPKN